MRAFLCLLVTVLVSLVFVSVTQAHTFELAQISPPTPPELPADVGLTPIAAAISGVAIAEAHCGGAPWGAWGAVYLDENLSPLPHLYLDPIVCNKLHRFQQDWRPNAACLRRVSRCDTGYLSLSALVLTHEAIHISGDLDEASTECKAIQRVRTTFALFGETNKLYVDALVRYALWWHIQETKIVSWLTGLRPYYSPDCKRDGAWDLSPGDGIWP